jgi:hypothetical protein
MLLVSDTVGKMPKCFHTRRFISLGMLHGEEWCRITDVLGKLDDPIFMVDCAVHRDSSEQGV